MASAQPLPPDDSRDLAPARGGGQRFGLTPRALLLGLLMAAFCCVLIVFGELMRSTLLGFLQFPAAAVASLLLVVVVNRGVQTLAPRLALRPPEIIVIYAMSLVGTMVTSVGVLEKLVPTLICVNYFATPATRIAPVLFPHFPSWAVAFDPEGGAGQRVARHFYEGLPPGAPVPWGLWITPLLAWGVVVILLIAAYFCLAAILRRQWADNERLSFPLALLPVELATDSPGAGSFFRNRLMWFGFSIPTVIYVLNFLHANWPGIPEVPLFHDFGPALKGAGLPWSAMAGWTYLRLSFGGLGLAYFLPTEVLLSMWVFFWFGRLENVGFALAGVPWEGMPSYPTALWSGYQAAGAFLVLVAYMARAAWPHLKQVYRAAVDPRREDQEEFLPLRLALAGLLLASAGAVLWFVKLGMTPAMALLEVLVLLFVTVPVMARSVSEAGLIETETSFRPVSLAALFVPLPTLGAQNLSAIALADSVFMRDQRCNLLATFLDCLKMSDLVHLRRRALRNALLAALVVILIGGALAHVAVPYKVGALKMWTYAYTGTPQWLARDSAAIIQAAPKYDPRLVWYFLSGLLMALWLGYMRTSFAWWPLTPLGLALSGTWGIIVLWFSFFLAWLIKGTVMRYGGWKAFTALRPFFLGLVLGEFSQVTLWALVASLWRLQSPSFPF